MNTGATPLISVIIPTYDRAATLGRALTSVHDQTFQDFEILVIDDGSTDGTEDLIRGWGAAGTIRYQRGDHRGAAGARNRGIDQARGRYIAFLDSDDEWLPEKLTKQVQAFAAAPADTGVIYCDMTRVLTDGRTHLMPAPSVVRGCIIDPVTRDYQVKRLGIQSVLIDAKLLVQGMRFDESLLALEDLDLLLRLAQVTDFQPVRRPLVRYYAGPGVSTQTLAVAAARQRLLDRYRDTLSARPEYLAYQYRKIGLACLRGGDAQGARAFGRTALRVSHGSPGAVISALVPALGLRNLLNICLHCEKLLGRS